MLNSLKSYKQSLNQIDLWSLEAILGAVEVVAWELPAKQSNHTTELLYILSSAMSNCVDLLSFSSIHHGLSIISQLSNFTSNTVKLAAVKTASEVLTYYTHQRLPNEIPTIFVSSLLHPMQPE